MKRKTNSAVTEILHQLGVRATPKRKRILANKIAIIVIANLDIARKIQ